MTIAELSPDRTGGPDHSPRHDDVTALTWRCPQPDLWVAVDDHGRPAGIVSQRRRGLFVTTAVTGHALGQHESLAGAQAALERHARPAPVTVAAPDTVGA
ncbi:hypothetical protein [Herbiconiux flava]|uniref:Uncharacterized protein n=1 Tax=Herbiconiux flava TaxID=881268 RepID=A0A852S7H3_9MICO|nr:hypothetical protein [Herbiconiux flava]NYD69208.1 hypothetical protein [Herbiconiux flava]GLK15957.1 hypothetical protein GCM10017602_04390 [Herbiconiux flava]